MKNYLKKILVTICAVSAALTVSTATVSATEGFRSGPDENTSVTDTAKTATESSADKAEDSGPSTVTSQAGSQNVSSNKYLTKWGGFFWFLLSVVVNFIISCWVGNRFYRLARRSAQSSAEIRALRKDIEEKFASTLKDIDEPVTEVINSNESYARSDEGIEMPESRQNVEINDEEREILGRWDMKRMAENKGEGQRSETSRRTYSPTRAMSGIEFEEDDSEEKAEEPTQVRSKLNSIAKAGNKAGNKAKDFLSNIFPFDD